MAGVALSSLRCRVAKYRWQVCRILSLGCSVAKYVAGVAYPSLGCSVAKYVAGVAHPSLGCGVPKYCMWQMWRNLAVSVPAYHTGGLGFKAWMVSWGNSLLIYSDES